MSGLAAGMSEFPWLFPPPLRNYLIAFWVLSNRAALMAICRVLWSHDCAFYEFCPLPVFSKIASQGAIDLFHNCFKKS